MNLLSRIIAGAAIAQLRERLAASNQVRAKLSAFSSRATAATNAVESLRAKFFETLADSDFEAWCEARDRLDTLVSCANDAGMAASWRADAEIETDDVRELVLAALKDSAAALTGEVNKLAAAEQKRLADAGVEDAGENPALAKVRARIRELSDCHSDLTARPDGWGNYSGRYFAALNLR